MGRRSFTVEVVVSAKNQTQAAFSQLKKGMTESGIGAKLLDGVMLGLGQSVLGFAKQLPQMVIELTKLGINAQAAQVRFEQFAGGTDRATELLEAFQRGADGTVDKMGAMTSAARLLQMGLVTNADQMELTASLAVKLGDQTKSATDRISDFSLLLANQSIPRLDNFGISSGKVRARIKELQAATAGLSREEAFRIAVFEEGTKSLNILGDTSDLTKTKMDKLTAAIADAKQGFGEMGRQTLETSIEVVGGVDAVAESVRQMPETTERLLIFTEAMLKAGAAGLAAGGLFGGVDDAFEEFSNTIKQGALEMANVQHASEELRFAYTTNLLVVEDLTEETRSLDRASKNYLSSISGIPSDVQIMVDAMDEAARAATEQGVALRTAREAAEEAALAQLNLAAGLKDATSAQIAQAAITELIRAQEEGVISFGDMQTAISEVQLAFGLADEESIRLTQGIAGLIEGLGDGTIKASDFDGMLNALIFSTQNTQSAVDGLSQSITDIPDRTVIITVETRRVNVGGPESGGILPQTPSVPGGPALDRGSSTGGNTSVNNDNRSFNMNVTTGATTPSVIEDFELAEAMMQ